MNFFASSQFFGIVLCLVAYQIGLVIARKVSHPLCNPLIIAIALVILFLAVTGIPYEDFNASAKFLSLLMTPATISLAVLLHENFKELRSNWKALLIGIGAGVFATLCCIAAGVVVFSLTHDHLVTLLPKGITTAVALAVSQELGGYPALTMALVVITGNLGNMFAEVLCKFFKISDPVAVGAAIGTSSHVLGTAKASQMGSVQGAMSSLAIIVAALMTVAGAAVFAQLL